MSKIPMSQLTSRRFMCITETTCTDWACFGWSCTEQGQTCLSSLHDLPSFSSAQSADHGVNGQSYYPTSRPTTSNTPYQTLVTESIKQLSKRERWRCLIRAAHIKQCLVQVALYALLVDNVGFRCNKNAIYSKTLMTYLTSVMWAH